MQDDGTRGLQQQLISLERNAVTRRLGVVTDVDPLSVALGGNEDAPYIGVPSLVGSGRIALNDVVLCIVAGGNDLIVLGPVANANTPLTGPGAGYQTAGPSGSDTGITSGTLTALTGGPSLTVQADGSYEVTFGMTMQTTAAGVNGLVGALRINGTGVGGSPTAYTDRLAHIATAQFGGGACVQTIDTVLAAGDVLTLGRASQNGVASAFSNGYIRIRPSR